MNGVNAELVTEFAKDKVWEENKAVFDNQAYIFGKQSFRLSRCADKVDVIVTDCPLPISIFYNHDPRLTENFNKTVMDVFNSYYNVNFLIQRCKPYNPIGRQQTETESDKIYFKMKEMLDKYDIAYLEKPGVKESYDSITKSILEYFV